MPATPAVSCSAGHVPKKYLPIDLFDIHVRLYRCVKIWMVKIWRFFGQSSISPNFSGAKVSLYMVIILSFTMYKQTVKT